MADDSEKRKKLGEFPTLQFEAINVEDHRESTPTSVFPGRTMHPNQATEPPDFEEENEEFEKTRVLSRNELIRNAHSDSSQHRTSKKTVPLRPSVQNVADSDRTLEAALPFELMESTRTPSGTLRKNPLQEENTRQAPNPLHEVTRNTVGHVDQDEGQLQYPARIQKGYTLPIPEELAQELEIQEGDLVLITVRKLR